MLQELSYELVRDQLQLTGQADVFLRFCWCTTKYFRFFIAIFIAMRVNLEEVGWPMGTKEKLDNTVKELAKTNNKVCLGSHCLVLYF